MKYKFISIVCLLVLISNARSETITIDSWEDVSNEMISETKKVKDECRKIELSNESKSIYKPEFPSAALRKKIQGYSIFEFKISHEGEPKLIGSSVKTNKIFEKQALNSFEKLKFVVPNDWDSTCADQTYRIGYAFRILTDCTGTEFPKPIINICTVGMIGIIKNGKAMPANIKFKDK